MLRSELWPGADLFVLPAYRFTTFHLLLVFRQVLSAPEVTLGALLPRVLRRGTRRFPTLPLLAGHLDDLYGAGMGLSAAKLGDHQTIELSFSCANAAGIPGDKVLLEGATLAAEVLAQPAGPPDLEEGLNPDYVREEKEALARDQAGLADDRMAYAHHRCIEEMCAGEPYAFHSLGRPEDLAQLDPVRLDDYRRRVLYETPLSVYLVGPVGDPGRPENGLGELPAALAAALDPLARVVGRVRRPERPPSAAHPRPAREREVIESAPVEQGRLVVGLQTGVVHSDPLNPVQVLYNGLLGGFVHSRLFRRIRDEAGLAYYAWSRLVSTKGLVIISCGIEERNYHQTVELIREELAALARGEFSDAEFEATRNSVLAVAKAQLDSPSALIYGHLERTAAGRTPAELAPWRDLGRVTAAAVREFAARPVVDTVYLLGRDGGGGASPATGGAPPAADDTPPSGAGRGEAGR